MKKLVIILLLISLVTFSSCGKKEKVNSDNNEVVKNVEENVEEDEYNNTEEEVKELDYVLFLQLNGEPYLVSERFTIKSNDEKAKGKTIEEVALNSLINFSDDDYLKSPVPKETKLINFSKSGRLCSIDLSKEFVTNLEGDSYTTELTIASIVNTITVLNNYDSVIITIEGEIIEDLNGVDISKEFAFFNKFFFEK